MSSARKTTANLTHPRPPERRSPIVRIGCAGWSIPAAHADRFGDGESVLARYATRFNGVEINSSFYRPHRVQTYERWAASVPRDFLFSTKLPKSITHDARLYGVADLVQRFVDEVSGLGDKLGGVLVQLPPSLVHDARIANTFFAMLRRRFDVPLACEPRHPSWFEPVVDALWVRHGIARVAADPARPPAAAAPGGAGAWTYWRWHGSPDIYYSAYDDTRLSDLEHALRLHAPRTGDAWCIFDNTAAGHAIADALRLRERMAAQRGDVVR
jgi:uncharacterized protein YecE (DUF72 family)